MAFVLFCIVMKIWMRCEPVIKTFFFIHLSLKTAFRLHVIHLSHWGDEKQFYFFFFYLLKKNNIHRNLLLCLLNLLPSVFMWCSLGILCLFSQNWCFWGSNLSLTVCRKHAIIGVESGIGSSSNSVLVSYINSYAIALLLATIS